VLFEWDREKNLKNQRRHGVSFEVAKLIFNDPNILSWIDTRFDYNEERWISLGSVQGVTILVVAHQVKEDKDGKEIIRIISARAASRSQQSTYLRGNPEDAG